MNSVKNDNSSEIKVKKTQHSSAENTKDSIETNGYWFVSDQSLEKLSDKLEIYDKLPFRCD